MNLTPREKDKLLVAMAANVARRRLEREAEAVVPVGLGGVQRERLPQLVAVGVRIAADSRTFDHLAGDVLPLAFEATGNSQGFFPVNQGYAMICLARLMSLLSSSSLTLSLSSRRAMISTRAPSIPIPRHCSRRCPSPIQVTRKGASTLF